MLNGKVHYYTIRKLLSSRWFLLSLGCFLIWLGQRLIDTPSGILSASYFFPWLDDYIRPGISNIGETVTGYILFTLAIGVFSSICLQYKSQITFSRSIVALRLPFIFFSALSFVLVAYGLFLLTLSKGLYQWSYSLFWVLSLGTVGWLLFLFQKKKTNHLSFKLNHSVWIFILFFLAAAILLYRLDTVPGVYLGDEGDFFRKANDLALGLTNDTLFDSGTYTFPILGNYYQAFFLRLFGPTIFAWRLSSVVMGLVTIIPLYAFCKEWWDKKVALFAVLFMITANYFLAFSRLGYSNIHAVPLVSLTILFLSYATTRQRLWLWYAVGVSIGFCFFSYAAAQVSIIITILFLFYKVLCRHYKVIHGLLFALCIALGIFLTYAPYVVRTHAVNPESFSHKWAESIFFNIYNAEVFFPDILEEKNVYKWNSGPFTLFFDFELWKRLLLRGTFRSVVVLHHKDIVDAHFIVGSLSGYLQGILLIVGLGVAFKGFRIRDDRMVLVLLWFGSSIIFLSSFNTIGARWTHMVPIIPSMAILAAIGLREIARMNTIHGNRRLVIMTILTLVAIIGISAEIRRYYILSLKRYDVHSGAHYPLQYMKQFGADIAPL